MEIAGWPRGIGVKFARILNLIKNCGPEKVGMPHIKPMKQGLFEIRANGSEGIGRAFFCIKKGRVIIILSCFIKKTQKTPASEIALARKRMEEVL